MGSLSAGVGMGNAGTGAICAPAPLLGRPTAQNGSSSCFGGSAGVVVLCWAMAGHTPSARPLTPRISHTIRLAIEALVMTILLGPLGPWSAGVRRPYFARFAGAMLARHPGEVKGCRATPFTESTLSFPPGRRDSHP